MSLSITAASITEYTTSPSGVRVTVANSTAQAKHTDLAQSLRARDGLMRWEHWERRRLSLRFSADSVVLSNDLLITFTTRAFAASRLMSSLHKTTSSA